MIPIEKCSAIFEVAFGVNAVATAAVLYFKQTHREVARRLYVELRPPDSPLSGPLAEHRFEQFILDATLGLRAARWTYRVLVLFGLAAALTALFGLLASATWPQREIRARWLWIFAIVALLVLPTAYWAYRQFLGWFERAFTLRKVTPAERDFYWRAFEIIYPLPDLHQEMQEMRWRMETVLMANRWHRFRHRWVDTWERVGEALRRVRRD
jgi:hypothetical protein